MDVYMRATRMKTKSKIRFEACCVATAAAAAAAKVMFFSLAASNFDARLSGFLSLCIRMQAVY